MNGQTVRFDPLIGPYEIQLLRFKVEGGLMKIKGNSTFPKASGLEPLYPMTFCVNTMTLVGGGGGLRHVHFFQEDFSPDYGPREWVIILFLPKSDLT